MYIKNGRIVTENKIFDGFVKIDNGVITLIGEGNPSEQTPEDIDAKGNLVTPGFIDIHCHGGGDSLFADNPHVAYNAHLKKGTTGIVPTIGYNMTASKFLDAVSGISVLEEPGILGINCEGPFINPEYGADTRLVRKFDVEQAEAIYKAGTGKIKIWMFSPDLDEAEEIRKYILSKSEIIPCAGHTACTKEQLKDIKLICHLYDAMGPKARKISAIHENGTAEVVLASDYLYAELIADSKGVHVPGELLKIAYRCLKDKCIVISDAISTENGRADINYNDCGELAGSLLSVSRAVVNFKNHTGISWPEAVRCGSLNPAVLLGVDDKIGSIKKGKDADIVIMDEEANVKFVIQKGRII